MAPFSPDYQPVTVANQSGQFITINLENASGGFPYYEGTLLRITAIRSSDGVTRTDVTINQHTYTPDHLEYSPTGPGAVEVINPWNTDGNTPTAATFIVERISEPLQSFSPDPGEMVNLNALEAQLNAQLEVLQELRAKIYGYGNPLAGADVIQSVHGFTIPSKLVRALKFVKFDAIGDLDLVSGPDWSEILNKPSTFPPSAHTHTWSEIENKPLAFPPSAHGHPFEEISGDVPWERIVNVPNDLGGAGDWSDITNKPATFPPSAHDHAGDNLGNPAGSAPETPDDRRVQTLFARTLDIPSTGTVNLANARLFPTQGGDLFTFQIWDSVAETHVDAMEMAYDPNAAQPLASLVHYCPGSLHTGFRLIFGTPEGLDNPYFRADDLVPGAPFENDAINLYFNGTAIFSWSEGTFTTLDPATTLGSAGVPWPTVYTDKLNLGPTTEIRGTNDNIEFWFENPFEILDPYLFINNGGIFVGAGKQMNIGTVSAPFISAWINNIVSAGGNSSGWNTVTATRFVANSRIDARTFATNDGAVWMQWSANLGTGSAVLTIGDIAEVNQGHTVFRWDENAGLLTLGAPTTVVTYLIAEEAVIAKKLRDTPDTIEVTSGSRTLLETESGRVVMLKGGNVSLPANAVAGTYYTIIRNHSSLSNTVEFANGIYDPTVGGGVGLSVSLDSNNSVITVMSNGDNEWVVVSKNGSFTFIV